MTTAKPLIDSSSIYDRYRIAIRFRDKLCGGKPRNPELLRTHVLRQLEATDEAAQALAAEAAGNIDAVVEQSWNGFLGDEQGLYIDAFQIKALFKECASLLRITVEKMGSKQILQHGFEVKATDGSNRIHLDRAKPDGYDEGPIHVVTAQGPRTAIKRVDYVMGVRVEFELWVLGTAGAEKRHLGEKEIQRMLALGQENGIGADRSQGRGKFDVVEFEMVAKAPVKEKDGGK